MWFVLLVLGTVQRSGVQRSAVQREGVTPLAQIHTGCTYLGNYQTKTSLNTFLRFLYFSRNHSVLKAIIYEFVVYV